MFWVRYFAALAVGTAAVYFLAPAVGARLGIGASGDVESIGGACGGEGESPAGRERTDTTEDVAGAATGAPVVAQAPGQPSSGRGKPPRVASVGRVRRQDTPRVKAPEGQMAQQTEAEPAGQPSLSKIPQSADDIIRWGAMMVNSPVFAKDGKRLPGEIPGGALVEITKTTFTSKGVEMALCQIWNGSRWLEPCLVATGNIAMFEGTREGLDAADVENLMAYLRLNAALAARKDALEKAALNANPHFAALAELNTKNKQMAAKSKELTDRRDKATGAERARIADELRRMEVESARLNDEIKRKVALYEEWKKSHPAKASSVEEDPEYLSIKARMRDAEPGVAMFGFNGGVSP